MLPKFLEDVRLAYQEGDPSGILIALAACLREGAPVPPWLLVAFLQGVDAVSAHQVKSWDDAFGSLLPKGAHLNAAKKAAKLMEEVHLYCYILSQRQPIDDALFEEVGREYNIGKTLAQDYYYTYKKILEKTGILREYYD